MRTILLSIALLLFSFGLFGQQKMTVRGTVADSTGSPLSAATVVLLQAQDSVMSAFAITGNDGAFVLKRVAPGEYLLQVSYVGYDVLFQPLSLTGGQQEVDAGTLVLKEAATDLESISTKICSSFVVISRVWANESKNRLKKSRFDIFKIQYFKQ